MNIEFSEEDLQDIAKRVVDEMRQQGLVVRQYETIWQWIPPTYPQWWWQSPTITSGGTSVTFETTGGIS